MASFLQACSLLDAGLRVFWKDVISEQTVGIYGIAIFDDFVGVELSPGSAFLGNDLHLLSTSVK